MNHIILSARHVTVLSLVMAIISAVTLFSMPFGPHTIWTGCGLVSLLLISIGSLIGGLVVLITPDSEIAALTVTNFNQAMDSAELDESVGIAHAALAGSVVFRLHTTKLLPGAKVKAHRHGAGEELYIIQSGSGHLYTGQSLEPGVEEWFEAVEVTAGDTFAIAPAMLHQLHNTGDTPLILIFGCPDSHLASDRVVVADCPFVATACSDWVDSDSGQ